MGIRSLKATYVFFLNGINAIKDVVVFSRFFDKVVAFYTDRLISVFFLKVNNAIISFQNKVL